MFFSNIYKDKNILITGCNGFKGSWLSLWLLELGANVKGISLEPPSNPSHFESLSLEQFIENKKIDIRDFDKLKKTINQIKPDFIFHLAAQSLVQKSYKRSLETFQINTLGTINLLEVLKDVQHFCRVILITSDKCYENVEWIWGYKETDKLGGIDPYSASKAAAEIAISSYMRSFFCLEKHPVKICSTRAGNVIGGGDWAENRIVPDCIKSWSKKEPVFLRNPSSTRPWQHVLEPISGYLRLGEMMMPMHSEHSQSFNFGPNQYNTKSVKDLVEKMTEFWPESSYKISIESKYQKEAKLLKLNCDKSYEKLNWKPVLDFDETIEMTTKWYFSFYNKNSTLESSRKDINKYIEFAKERKISWIY